jgi:hypothetical protein
MTSPSKLARDGAVGFIVRLGFGCALAIQLNLVSIRIADINGKAVVLLHRLFGKPASYESAARLLCLLWRD